MFAEDTSLMFDTTLGFAQLATVGGASVAVIFDNASAPATVGPYGMASSQPAITLPTAQVPSDPVGTAVVVNAVAVQEAVNDRPLAVDQLVVELVFHVPVPPTQYRLAIVYSCGVVIAAIQSFRRCCFMASISVSLGNSSPSENNKVSENLP